MYKKIKEITHRTGKVVPLIRDYTLQNENLQKELRRLKNLALKRDYTLQNENFQKELRRLKNLALKNKP